MGNLRKNPTQTVSDYYFTRRMYFAFVCVFILWGISAYMMCVDLNSVPREGTPAFYEMYPDHFAGQTHEDPTRFWEWDMGNGFVSNIEHYVMMACGLFGWMRFTDLMLLWHRRDRELSFAFWFERFD